MRAAWKPSSHEWTTTCSSWIDTRQYIMIFSFSHNIQKYGCHLSKCGQLSSCIYIMCAVSRCHVQLHHNHKTTNESVVYILGYFVSHVRSVVSDVAYPVKPQNHWWSDLDYCNSLVHSMFNNVTDKNQYDQNTAEHSKTRTSHCSHWHGVNSIWSIPIQQFQFCFFLTLFCLILFTMSRYPEYLLEIHTPSSLYSK